MITSSFSIKNILAWSVHCFTALAAVVALLTLNAIFHQQYMTAFAWMAVALIIDCCDGTLARKTQVLIYAPQIDGALLDNIVDYLNYVITPAMLLIVHSQLLPPHCSVFLTTLIVIASGYQFTQRDAKTPDHFFKGFPSYWNFVVFYIFIVALPTWINMVIIMLLVLLVFVPIKFVYPSRMEYLTPNKTIRRILLGLSIGFGVSNIWLLWSYPDPSPFAVYYLIAYIFLYFFLSLYCTWRPSKLDVYPEQKAHH